MPLAKHSPFLSPVFWWILLAGFLLVPFFAFFDLQGVGPRLHFDMTYGISGAGFSIIGFGFLLSILAPWSSRGPAPRRIGLSVAIGVVWLVSMDVFLEYHAAWYSHREHAQEIEAAYNERLVPAMAFIRRFYNREHRLPTDEELEIAGWKIGYSYPYGDWNHQMCVYRHPSSLDGQGVPGKDFVVETLAADWIIAYRSWDDKRVEFTRLGN